MPFTVMQLRKNMKFTNLKTWYRVRNMNDLPKEIDPIHSSYREIQNNLEDKLCNDICLHRYKVIKDREEVLFQT